MWLIILLLFLSIDLFAQGANPPWWLSLENGKQRFRSQDYGTALMLFEDARRNRRAMYEQMERDLINLLSLNDVRRLGDYLDRVERFSNDRHYTAASAALEELYYRVPKASLNNSALAALTALGKLKDYPEAEYWIGEIYRIEGELSLALSQYRRALSMRANLEDPNFSTTLQYKIASILRTRQEFDEMIIVLESIIADKDTLWADARAAANTQTGSRGEALRPSYQQASASFARTAMTSTLTNHGINRFLEMYRYNNNTVEQAHRLLGLHLVISGRPSAEDHLMFAFLIQNTIIIEEVRRRQFDFTYTNLQDLAREINRNQLLLSYMEEVEYYKTTYYLAASLFRNGKTAVSRSIWEFLASQPQAGEWYDRAVSQLRNPRVETIVIMP
ncbi:MAG: hypothetical protein FWD47_02780 [Treponema sp.]|nr:hypothetical protein [Treponema sp.]